MWDTIRTEAQAVAEAEPALSSSIHAAVLSQPSFDRALAYVLANRLASPQLAAVQLVELCNDVLDSEEQVGMMHACLGPSQHCTHAAHRRCCYCRAF